MKRLEYPLKKFNYEEFCKLPYKYVELIYGRIYLKYTLPVPLSIRIGYPIKGKKTMQNLKINYNTCKTE